MDDVSKILNSCEVPRVDPPVSEPVAVKLALVSVWKAFGNRSVLRDLSLEVSSGEVVGLFGADGAGKSVCFYTIFGLIKPDGGRIKLNGIDISTLPTYRRARLGLGYLSQENSLFRGLSVEQNLIAILEMSEPDQSARSDRLERIVLEFDLGRLRRRSPDSLSGGERRRVKVARAMALAPDIRLLDEPFAGGPFVAEIKRMILQLKDRGPGVLVTDYYVRGMLGVIDRSYVIHEGSVIFSGPSSAMIEDSAVRRHFLGETYQLPLQHTPGLAKISYHRAALLGARGGQAVLS